MKKDNYKKSRKVRRKIKKNFVSLKSDYLFKKYFLNDPPKYKILKSFLIDFLNLDQYQLQDLKAIERSFDREYKNDKIIIMDILVELKNGETINIEMQSKKDKDFLDRTFYYTVKRLVEQVKKGDGYTLKKTYSINIVDFDLDSNEDYFRTMDLNNSQFPFSKEYFEMGYLELTKVRKQIGKISERKLFWGLLFSANSMEDLKMLEKASENFDEQIKKLKDFQNSAFYQEEAEYQKEIEMRIKAREDYVREQGIEQGIEQEKINTVLGMLNDKLEDDIIIKYTRISPEDLEKLKRQL